MPANLENSAVATGLEKVSFTPIPKKGNAKEFSNYGTIAFISHASKVMLKILQDTLQHSTWTVNFQMFKVDLEKAEEPELKLPTSTGLSKNQENSRKTSKVFDCVDHNTLWKILKEMGIPDHLTCLLRNLYAGQEATARTGYGTTDWFQIGKGVRQSCKLSSCLFYLYAEYIMRKRWAGWRTSSNEDCREKDQ